MIDSQPAGPVSSPRTSTTSGVFSQVRTAVGDRLNHTVTGYNRIPNLIASSNAARPRADINNDMVAAIAAYTPQPGRQAARHMSLEVLNTPPPRVDNVIDAIQRYLDIRPRREPTADPKDEASVARHPQQIIESAGRWDDAMRYRFADNGASNRQFNPEYNAWAGGLDLTLKNEGSAEVSAPPTRSPLPGASGPDLSTLGDNAVHDPVDAAQAAMAEMIESQAPAPEPITSGAPLITDDPYFDPAYAAQNAAAKIREDLRGSEQERLTVGRSNIIDDPSRDPARNYQDTAAEIRRRLERPERDFVTVGQPNRADDPEKDPVHIAENIAAENLERLNRERRDGLKVGAANMADNVLDQPRRAWCASAQVAVGVSGQSGLNMVPASSFRPLAESDAYIRAIRVIDSLNRAQFSERIVGEKV